MKKSLHNLLIISLLCPVLLAAQKPPVISFSGKNLHELRALAHPSTVDLYFFEMSDHLFFSKKWVVTAFFVPV